MKAAIKTANIRSILVLVLLIAGNLYSQPGVPSVTLKEYIETKIDALDAKTTERYPSKTEYLSDLAKVQDDIRELREYKAYIDGKASQSSVNLSLLISSLSLVFSFGNLFGVGKKDKSAS